MIKNAEDRKVIRLDPSVKTLTFTTLLDAGLAQLVEQLTLNQLVRGSSPRPGTKIDFYLATPAFGGTTGRTF